MAVPLTKMPSALKTEVISALTDWVNSLPPTEAASPAIRLLGASYSPLQILYEVQRESEFGQQYLEGLYELHKRMIARHRNASISALIRRSVREQSAEAGAGAGE